MTKRLMFLTGLLLFTLSIALIRHSVMFVYVNPLVKTNVFSYLSEGIRPVDQAVNYALKETKKTYPNVHLNFQNAYGSGFLQSNEIPNDLDYSVGINLGRYKYNEKNAYKVATEIVLSMNKFQSEFCSYVETNSSLGFYPTITTMSMISGLSSKERSDINDVAKSFDNIMKNKDYVVYYPKQMAENVIIDFPFIMKSNEILIENMEPISIFSRKVKYNKEQTSFLREITIEFECSFELENEKTGEVKNINLVAEAFNGQRLQLARRFFVPSVFINNYSAKTIENLAYRNDENLNFNQRMADFGRCLQLIKNLNLENDRPVKMLKRLLQCADIISPMLDDKTFKDINITVSESLNNENIRLINDYSTIMDNLSKLMMYGSGFQKAMKSQQIVEMLNIANNSILKLKDNKMLTDSEFKKITEFNKKVATDLFTLKNARELRDEWTWFANYRTKEIYPIENKIAARAIKNKDKINSYINIFDKIYKDAGYHQIDLYWLDRGEIGVILDDYTKNFKKEDLQKIVEENNLVDVKYKFINKKDVDNMRVRYSVWVRYNPTKQQQDAYNTLRSNIKNSMKDYSIKRKLIL